MEVWNWVILILACVLLIAIVAYVVVLAVKNKWISEIFETVSLSIKEAEEKFPEPGSGKLKQEYVLIAVQKKCEELKIPYKILELIVKKLINTIISNYNIISK